MTTHNNIPQYDDMDEEEFYRLLYDHYVAYQDVPGVMRLWDVASPSSFMPRSHYVLTVEGTYAHWTLHITMKDSGHQFTVTPQAGWWAWAHQIPEVQEAIANHRPWQEIIALVDFEFSLDP